MSETIERLRQDHRNVLARLADFEAQQGAETDASTACVGLSQFLSTEVAEHFEVEEQALFPLLGRHLSEHMGPLAVMLSEHAEFRELQHSLEHAITTGDSTTQRSRAAAIIELLRAHIAKEDNALFPMAERLLAPDELAEVDRRAGGFAS